MRVAMQRKSVVRQRPTEDLNAQVLRLSRENSALRREVAKLQVFRSMAYRDPLTGLWNRRYFEERLAEEESRSQRAGSSRRFSLLVVDINDFKVINDQHGHPVGDALLKWAGEFLHTHLRTHDVACRTGGDEFAVLLPDVSAEDAARLVARLREQLVVANRTREIPLGMSLGAATWPDAGAATADLVAHADEEMYADKRRQKAAAAITKPVQPTVETAGRASALRARATKVARPKAATKDASTPAPKVASAPSPIA
jgi:diguanylate cyclase (GGDEF)-like protein